MDEERDSGVTIAALLITIGALYVWFRVAGKLAEKAVTPIMRLSSRSIGEVIARAEQITKQAVEAGKDGNGAS